MQMKTENEISVFEIDALHMLTKSAQQRVCTTATTDNHIGSKPNSKMIQEMCLISVFHTSLPQFSYFNFKNNKC